METRDDAAFAAEQALLGALLADRDAIADVVERITADAFSTAEHRAAYGAIASLWRQRVPADVVTVGNEMTRAGATADYARMCDWLLACPYGCHARYYADVVIEHARQRAIADAGADLVKRSLNGGTDPDEAFMALRTRLDKFGAIAHEGPQRYEDTVYEWREKLKAQWDGLIERTETPTGFRQLDRTLSGGFRPGELIVVGARSGMGKCLTGSTVVVDAVTGDPVPLERFVRGRRRFVMGLSDDGSIRTTMVTDWIESGIQPCFRVTTRTGKTIEATGSHPFLTVEGWAPLETLAVGAEIATARALPVFGMKFPRDEMVRLAAYFVAEGGLTGTTPRFTNTDPEIVQDFTDCINRAFPGCTIRHHKMTYAVCRPEGKGNGKPDNPVTVWLRDIGIWGKLAEEKAFPGFVWNMSRRQLRVFLSCLFSCDGTIYSVQGCPRIEFTVASRALAEDVRHALTRFGIVGKFWQKTDRSWRVEITDPVSVDLYQREIGWIGEKQFRFVGFPGRGEARRSYRGLVPSMAWGFIRASAERQELSLSELARRSGETVGPGFNPNSGKRINAERLGRFAAVLEDANLKRLASPDIFWDEIVAIDPIGAQPTYDLTVPDGANFVANDIIVHNSAFMLQLAHNAARYRSDRQVLIFSAEMSRESLFTRGASEISGLSYAVVKQQGLDQRFREKVLEATGVMEGMPVAIDDQSGVTTGQMQVRIERAQAHQPVSLVIFDYLEIAGDDIRGDSEERRVAEIARRCKHVARVCDVPFVLLSQLSREVERRAGSIPKLSDLRYSGAIEANADVVLLLYRPGYYMAQGAIPQDDVTANQANVIVAKQRNGPTPTLTMRFDAASMTFREYE